MDVSLVELAVFMYEFLLLGLFLLLVGLDFVFDFIPEFHVPVKWYFIK